MTLSANQPIGFIPTHQPEAARRFYKETLGLRFESDDQFAMVFRLGPAPGVMLRVVRMPEFTPVPYTVLGWEADDLEKTVDELAAKGVTFLRYDFLEQDDRAIWHSPGGAAVVWFRDPDGNTLSVSQHTA